MKGAVDIDGSQRMNPKDVVTPLTFPLVPLEPMFIWQKHVSVKV